MKHSKKLAWGLTFAITGWIAIVLGLLLCFSLIGACLGIPMILVGLPMFILGAVWLFQYRYSATREIIASGIREGVEQARMNPSAPTAPPAPPTAPSSPADSI